MPIFTSTGGNPFFLTIESLVNKESPQPPGYGLLSLLVDKNHWLLNVGE